MEIGAIVRLGPDKLASYVPPLTDYQDVSTPWTETEFHCANLSARNVRVGYWRGEPGFVVLDPWPYTEICSILSGRVAVEDFACGRLEFGAGEGFLVPQSFRGRWVTLETATKFFIAVS